MSATPNVLLLGGTTEASALARLFAERGVAATLSYAGRTEAPRVQPVPVRIGGFGGVAGLVEYFSRHRITHLVNATHPFAATMSAHAVEAAQLANVPHVALTRPAWQAAPGDHWTHVSSIAEAVAALSVPSRRVMLALGRMHVDAFAAEPQHHYLLRFVDAPVQPPPLPYHTLVVDRGPFTAQADTELMRAHAVDLIVCKNAGGSGAQAKLIAARSMGLPVLMIDRPPLAARREVHDPHAVLAWLAHDTDRGV